MSNNEISIREKLRQIPFEPGIYKFLDKNKDILYVGKAKSLKKRVKSYFQKNHKSERTVSLVSQIKDIEFIITNTELEALILETNLIKEIRPKYNVLMKDDKNYVYIKVTKNEDFPRIYLTRKIEKDGAKYYGPKTSAKRVIQLLELIRKIFPIRNCTLEMELIQDFEDKSEVKVTKKTINYPCLEYHINRCAAPCIGLISKVYYQEMIDNICRFFEGHTKEIEDTIRLRMQKFAEEKKFEQAAKIRDNLQNIQNITEKQIISEPSLISRDIINYVIHEDTIILTVFVIRNGKLINQENFKLGTVSLNSMDLPDILTYLLKHYYQIAADFPNEVVVPHEFEDREIIEEYLKNEKGKKVNILIPQKGIKDQLLELARRNALIYSQTLRADFEKEKERTVGAIKNLGKILGIDRNLKRIEAFDISHLGGSETVASMIVFDSGKPLKSDYRRFKLRNFQGKIDDFGSMQEILKRRLK
ncbi:excinuclease ABC subunit C, partial [Candidatus Peregrinibacteria bacterium RIFOXYC2_FULL_33_13]